jgi:C-terminal processing protease CtpA/Prc
VSLAALCAAAAAVGWNGLELGDAWLHPEKAALNQTKPELPRWNPDLYAKDCDPSRMDGKCYYDAAWRALRDTNIELIQHPELRPVFEAMRHTFDAKADLDCQGKNANDFFCPGADRSIELMRDVLQGPFDYFLDVKETKAAEGRARSTLSGVGVQLKLTNIVQLLKNVPKGVPIEEAVNNFLIGPGHELVVASDPTDGPAKNVFKAGDVIVAVKHMADSTDAPTTLAGISYGKAIEAIRGDVGKALEITFERTENGVASQHTVKLPRATVIEHTVHVEELKTPKGRKVFKIKLDSFESSKFLDELLPILAETGKTAQGYLFQFDDNPGGNLGNAIAMIEATQDDGVAFAEKQRPYKADHLVYTEINLIGKSEVWVEVPLGADGSASGPAQVHLEKRQPLLINPEIPIVATINGGSASASEVVAGAWQAKGRATLIGARSIGKDQSQVIAYLPYGRSLHIPIAEFYPGGRKMPGGLVPNREVPLTWDDVEAGRNPVIDASLAALDEQIDAREELAGRVKAAAEQHEKSWSFQMCMRISRDQLPMGKSIPLNVTSDQCAQAVGLGRSGQKP